MDQPSLITGCDDVEEYLLTFLDIKSILNLRLMSKCECQFLDSLEYISQLKEIIVKGATPDCLSAIIFASKYGYIKLLKWIIITLRIRPPHDTKARALTKACKQGQLDIVKFLKEKWKFSRVSNDIIYAVIKNSDLNMLKYFSEIGIGLGDKYFIIKAISGGNLEIVKFFIDGGTSNSDVATLTKVAGEHGYLDILKYLVEKFQINSRDLGHILPPAAYNKQWHIVDYLWEIGANIHTQNDIVFTYCIMYDNFELFLKLLEDGANIHTDHEYPLRLAVGNGNLKMVEKLVGKGANIHYNGEELLKMACEKGHSEIATLLVSHGMDIKKHIGEIAGSAIYYGYLEILKLCVDNGFDIHTDDDRAFRMATKYGHLPMVIYLVELGAHINIQNGYALRHSNKYNNLDILNYLLKKGADISILPEGTKKIVQHIMEKIDLN